MYNSLLVLAYLENPTDFPLIRFLFTNLVLANATDEVNRTGGATIKARRSLSNILKKWG